MKKRIISAVLAAIALIFIMIQPPFVMGITVFAVSIVALYEFYQSVRKVEYYPVRIVGFFFLCDVFAVYYFPFICIRLDRNDIRSIVKDTFSEKYRLFNYLYCNFLFNDAVNF